MNFIPFVSKFGMQMMQRGVTVSCACANGLMSYKLKVQNMVTSLNLPNASLSLNPSASAKGKRYLKDLAYLCRPTAQKTVEWRLTQPAQGIWELQWVLRNS